MGRKALREEDQVLQQDLIAESSQLFQPTKLDPLGLNVIGEFGCDNKEKFFCSYKIT